MSWLVNGKKCAVPLCPTIPKDRIHRYPFPVEEKQRNEWLAALKSEDLTNMPYEELKDLRVCEKHFDPKFILVKIIKNVRKTQLSQNAIPTLYLPERIVVWDRETSSFVESNSQKVQVPESMDHSGNEELEKMDWEDLDN